MRGTTFLRRRGNLSRVPSVMLKDVTHFILKIVAFPAYDRRYLQSFIISNP